MSILDYLLLFAVAVCVVLAIRSYRKSGSCRCGTGGCSGCSRMYADAGQAEGAGSSAAQGCPGCSRCDKSTT